MMNHSKVIKSILSGDPAGHNQSGSNCSREVYIGDKFVYKFDDWSEQNQIEVERALEFSVLIEESNLDDLFVIPETWMVDNVVVQERLPGETFLATFSPSNSENDAALSEIVNEVERILFDNKIHIGDIHSENLILLPDGRIGLFDFGMDAL